MPQRNDSFEMDELSSHARAAKEEENNQDTYEDLTFFEKTSAISLWTWTAASLISLVAAILAFFPQFLLFLSETSAVERRTVLTPLEAFLAHILAIWLFALVISLIVNLPSSSPFPATETSTGHPLVVPSTLASLFVSFLSYNTRSIGTLSSINFIVFGTVGLWGLWVILFGNSLRISRKTGADKHTSAFIFGNTSSASKRKKQWLKQQGRHES